MPMRKALPSVTNLMLEMAITLGNMRAPGMNRRDRYIARRATVESFQPNWAFITEDIGPHELPAGESYRGYRTSYM